MKKLYGIGTGPGAPDLLTLRAVNVIKGADLVFAVNNRGKNMALETAKEFTRGKDLIFIDFPMGAVEEKDYVEAANKIYSQIPKGGYGVFLTIGDPMIYSTFIYIMNILEDKDIEIEVVPGIPSFVASAAASRLPLTVKGDRFMLLDELDPNLLDHVDSLALLKTLGDKDHALDQLESHGFKYKYIKRASLEEERILEDRQEIIEDRDYISLILARKES